MWRLPLTLLPYTSLKASFGFLKPLARSFLGFTRSKPLHGFNPNFSKRPFTSRARYQSLWKPFLFTLAFCVGTTYAVPLIIDNTPLKGILRRSPQGIVYALIAVNVAGFFLWKTPVGSRIMLRYGLLMKDKVYSMWSLLGSAFSHQDPMHIFFNMFVLQLFGTLLAAFLGASNFLVMYLNSAVISSFVSMALPVLLGSTLSVASLGALGAIFSVFGTFSWLFPRAAVGFFFIPVPGGAWMLYLATVAFNVAGLFGRWGGYDYAAHLGGCLAALGYGWWFDQKRRKRRQTIW